MTPLTEALTRPVTSLLSQSGGFPKLPILSDVQILDFVSYGKHSAGTETIVFLLEDKGSYDVGFCLMFVQAGFCGLSSLQQAYAQIVRNG